MTVQLPDQVEYNNAYFAIVAIDGSRIFNLEEYGLKPVGRRTDCWRGYLCVFKIQDDELVLDTLRVLLDVDPPPINGVSPKDDGWFGTSYEGLNLRINFTGGIHITGGIPLEAIENGHITDSWTRYSYDFLFQNGRVIQQNDWSIEEDKFWKSMEKIPMEVRSFYIEQWIKHNIGQNYELYDP